ncbi:MAG: signal peptidase II [Sedimentisphaerales bacterium]|nr:signal peptidase II [Sedimentisphaerales bacterium]
MAQLRTEKGSINLLSKSGNLYQHAKSCLADSKSQIIFWSLMITGFGLDLFSKRALFEWLAQRQYESIPLIKGILQIVAAENTGAAFGIAAGQRFLLIAVSSIALLLVLGVFLFGGIERRLIQIALALFAAGIAGNLWDRIFNDGRVRDFIDVVYWPGRHWPAFNVADSMLCIAVVFLMVFGFSTGKPCQKRDQRRK